MYRCILKICNKFTGEHLETNFIEITVPHGCSPQICCIFLEHLFTRQKQPSEEFCKKGDLRNFAKYTGKHLCQRIFFNGVAESGTASQAFQRTPLKAHSKV